MVDNSAPDSDEGVLTTFLSAEAATKWGDARLGPTASAHRRRLLLTDHVRHVFGSGSPEPIDYVDRDWVAEPWIGGGYSGVMRPGGWLACGPALREPVGRLHWASAERATVWTGLCRRGAGVGRARGPRGAQCPWLTANRALGPWVRPRWSRRMWP